MGAIAGAVAAPIIGGVIGNITSQGDRDNANRAYQDALQTIQNVGAPPDLAQAIILDKFKQAGVLTPQLEQAVTLGASKVSQIQEDPRLKQAQMGALTSLQQRGAGGLNPEDRAAYNQLRDESARDAEAKRQQILQNFAARGQGGGGAELISQLTSAQNTANQQSQGGDQLAAQASRNALQAMQQAGQLGGQIRGQDFSVNQAKASAEDAFNQFNTQNQIARQTRNVGAQNQAQQYNLQNEQNISNANVQGQNAELNRQNQAKENFWKDKLAQAQGVAGAEQQRGNQYQQQAQQNANMWSGMGNAAGGAFGSLAAANTKNTNAQNDAFAKANGFAHGGVVPCYSDGGEVNLNNNQDQDSSGSGLYGNVGRTGGQSVADSIRNSQNEGIGDKIRRALGYSDGGVVPHYFKHGGIVPGVPLVPGDSPLNDTQDIKASPGEIVLPNHVTQSNDPAEHAKSFVAGIIQGRRGRGR